MKYLTVVGIVIKEKVTFSSVITFEHEIKREFTKEKLLESGGLISHSFKSNPPLNNCYLFFRTFEITYD